MAAITITTTHTCLPFGELDEKSKGLVREKYGDFNTSCDWWDLVFSDFKERMTEKGLEVDLKKTYFALSYCQSDYAAFTAIVCDFAKILAAVGGFDEKEQALLVEAWAAGNIEVSAMTAQRGGQSSYCMTRNPYCAGEDGFAWAATVLEKFSDSCGEFFRGEAAELYRTLCKEYEGLTTDEALEDAFDANNCIFEVGTGAMFHTVAYHAQSLTLGMEAK